MLELTLNTRSRTKYLAHQFWTKEKVWLFSVSLIALLFVFAPAMGFTTLNSMAQSLLNVGPYLALSVAIAAYVGASAADGLIARAFTGSPMIMILIAAAAGGLSPFCSCGVIPLIAALLAMRVPLSAVMAFWLASPVMDPSMFLLTAGTLGLEFAIAKTLAALGLGIFGGFFVHMISRSGTLTDPLKNGVGNAGCGCPTTLTEEPVVWKFWRDDARVRKFLREGIVTTLFLAKWLTLAFILESLMLEWLPADLVVSTLGGNGIAPIGIATLVGVPAYLNGYAALPLVSGLIEQGMLPGAGMAFLVAGGVSSLPAAIAVWALVKRKVFILYLGIGLIGSFASGLLFQLWTAF